MPSQTLSALIMKLQALEAKGLGNSPVYLNDTHGNTVTIVDAKSFHFFYPSILLEYAE
jgi:ABC-type phosphate transport system auxiliary subunit